MHTEEQIEIEARGVREGINPMFGTWEQKFEIEPISYSNNRKNKDDFRKKVHSQIIPKYVFWSEVHVQITLYLNEQKAEENPQYGDLDNYAKQILDSIKGINGVIIDDCQVQSLGISWIDVPGESHFEILVKGGIDDFYQKPLKLYEMPDKKFYPLASQSWTPSGLIETPPEEAALLLNQLALMIDKAKKAKHKFRQSGMKSIEAYRTVKYVMPCLLGFHKSAVIDSGFELVKLSDWKSDVFPDNN